MVDAHRRSSWSFPYGRSAFWLLVIAIVSSLLYFAGALKARRQAPDLVFALFHQPHLDAYRETIAQFEKEHGVRVETQIVDVRVLPQRLQNEILADAEIPDLVEIEAPSFGLFTKGPLKDIGFLDITDSVRKDGLDTLFVRSRLDALSKSGRYFGLPHDVHPVLLVYRKDILDSLGLTPDSLQTWDDFTRIGRRISRADRFMIDLPDYGGEWLNLLIMQRGGTLFDSSGTCRLSSPIVAGTIEWYVKQIAGPARIAFPAGWGQSFSSALRDGLVLFVFAPDWRIGMIKQGSPELSGKMGIMPLPAWEKGGRRTSVHGGTGLFISKKTTHPALAWKLARRLYLDPAVQDRSFAKLNIIPASRSLWNLPSMAAPDPYFGSIAVGKYYAQFAPQTPLQVNGTYAALALGKAGEVLFSARAYYVKHGEAGLAAFIQKELADKEAYVLKIMSRNKLIGAGE